MTRVSELNSPELDYWVAKAERRWFWCACYSPSTDWSVGGRIIDQQDITIDRNARNTKWLASVPLRIKEEVDDPS